MTGEDRCYQTFAPQVNCPRASCPGTAGGRILAARSVSLAMPDGYVYLEISKDDPFCYKCKQPLVDVFIPANRGETLGDILPFNTEEALRWEHIGGYYSDWDMFKQTLVLCSGCTEELLGPYIRRKDTQLTPEMHHAQRRRRRDDHGIRARWQERDLRRKVKHGDILTGRTRI